MVQYRPEKTKLEDVEREIKTGKLIVTDFRDKLGTMRHTA